MDTLPSEMANEIIKLVDPTALYAVSRTCKQWYYLALQHTMAIKNVKDFEAACKRGDILSINQCKFNKSWVNTGLCGACQGGH